MKEFVEFLVKHIVDNPEKVVVEETSLDEHTIQYNVKVDKSDIGKVIGRHGNNINAMRTLVIAVGAKGKHRATLELVEE